MNGIEGIIFDCDGVLFESKQANLAYYNAILEEFDTPPVQPDEPERAHLCHTAASPVVFAGLLGEEHVDAALEIASQLDYRPFIHWMVPEPGLTEALSDLSGRMPLAVATNRGYSMPQILEHFALQDYFTTVVTSRDVPRPKPYPDMLIEASSRLNLPPEHLLFVGDSELDQKAAQSAGIRFAVYRSDLEADLTIGHHRELAETILKGGCDNESSY